MPEGPYAKIKESLRVRGVGSIGNIVHRRVVWCYNHLRRRLERLETVVSPSRAGNRTLISLTGHRMLETKICKISQCTISVHRVKNNTDLWVCKVICHYAQSASGRVSETELLKQERVVTGHVCGILCTRERHARVTL